MENGVIYAVITVLVIMLVLLIVVRIYLVEKLKWKEEYRIGYSMTIGSRQVQEDCYAVKEVHKGVMMVLADGMGKNYGGMMSSTLTVETVQDIFERENAFLNPQYFFQKALRTANNRILDRIDEGTGAASVAITLIHDMTLYYAGVGNVQISVFRDDDLIPVTEGHTIDILAQKKYAKGNLTRQKTIELLQEHRLYNYIGQDEFRDIELFDTPLKLKHGDIVVLMTDGVYDILPYHQLESILSQGHNCMEKAKRITALVEDTRGDKDNASILLLAV